MTDDPDRRTIRLEDPAERWEKREGFLTRLVIGWDGSASSTIQLRIEELQDVVNAAARQYRIYPIDPACDTCSDAGRVPWMSEGDPNFHQGPDDDGMIPCPDYAGERS